MIFVFLLLAGLSHCQLSDAEKEEILKSHNDYRSSVDPPASNMQTMVSGLCKSN